MRKIKKRTCLILALLLLSQSMLVLAEESTQIKEEKITEGEENISESDMQISKEGIEGEESSILLKTNRDILEKGEQQEKEVLGWNFLKITTNADSVQKMGQEVKIKAEVEGNTDDLQYKFVWMKNNWKEWKVLQEMSLNNEITFVPSQIGSYTLYIDVCDRNGKTVTKSCNYEVKEKVWNYKNIETDKMSPQEKYSGPINIKVNTEGETDALKYKYVWMKNNWKEWGVLQDFSGNSQVEWEPKESGEYLIYVDVKDVDGKVVTCTLPYSITKVNWNLEEIITTPEKIQKKGELVDIQAKISGTDTGLKYKFVWMRDNWKEWGVIREFSEGSSETWKVPDKSGAYKIIVDVKGRDGEVVSKSEDLWVVSQIWTYEGVDVNEGKQEQIYTHIPITGLTSGENESLEYKYVWMKDDWKEWGVIRDFSTDKNTSLWYPKQAGTYTIYCDVKDKDGRKETKTVEYTVGEAPWKLEKLEVNGAGSYYVGDNMTVKAVTSGENEGLKYKFVCRRGNDWSDWEVIRDFDEDNTITIPIEKATNYTIYVDIMDTRGVVFDAATVIGKGCQYTSVRLSSEKVSVGKSVAIYPNFEGGPEISAMCKFVWQKDGWKEWGVIQDFSDKQSVSWTPKSVGNYSVLVDVNVNGIVQTREIRFLVVEGLELKIEEIKKYTYVPYKYGGESLSGWDCSGFTQWAMKYMNIMIPRTAEEQSKGGTAVNPFNKVEWKVGDLIFFAKAGKVNHVALYLGNGMIMHALNSKYGTYITSVDEYVKWDKNNILIYVRRYM